MHPPTDTATQAQLIARACEPRMGDAFTGACGVSCVVTGLGGGKVSYEWRGVDGTKVRGITTLEDYRALVTNTITGGHTFTAAKSMVEILLEKIKAGQLTLPAFNPGPFQALAGFSFKSPYYPPPEPIKLPAGCKVTFGGVDIGTTVAPQPVKGWTADIKIDDNGQHVTAQPFVGPDFTSTLLKGGACG